MPSAALARLVSRCRGLAAPGRRCSRRFARSADPDAFAELVGRYAGLVWGVCRRTLPQEADAEDAFQAVFLALARGARAIDPSPPCGLLHAVAVRVSRRALGKTLRHRANELPETVGPADVMRDVTSRDLFRAVDEEIERLPAGAPRPGRALLPGGPGPRRGRRPARLLGPGREGPARTGPAMLRRRWPAAASPCRGVPGDRPRGRPRRRPDRRVRGEGGAARRRRPSPRWPPAGPRFISAWWPPHW